MHCAAALLEVVPGVMRAVRVQMRSSSSAELSVPQFRAIYFLSTRRGRSLTDVAEHIGLSVPSSSKLVQQLLLRGFIGRQVDPADRRRTLLTLTAKGTRVLEIARRATRKFLAESISTLEPVQRQSVLEAMRALRPIFMPEL